MWICKQLAIDTHYVNQQHVHMYDCVLIRLLVSCCRNVVHPFRLRGPIRATQRGGIEDVEGLWNADAGVGAASEADTVIVQRGGLRVAGCGLWVVGVQCTHGGLMKGWKNMGRGLGIYFWFGHNVSRLMYVSYKDADKSCVNVCACAPKKKKKPFASWLGVQ